MKRILAFIILLWLICSVAGCSLGSDAFDDIDPAGLPSKVDLRNYEGKNYVTPVKRQKNGDCWSFSLAGSAEIAYLFANDLGVPAGEVNDLVDFSEKYIAWYVYHGVTADDVVVGKVRSSQIGEGFDPSRAESSDKMAAYDFGGEFVHYANLFGSGFGPVDESVSVNGGYPYVYGGTTPEDWTLPLTAEYRNAPAKAFLRQARVLPGPSGEDADGGYVFDEDGLNAVKSELVQGHGVSLAVCTAHSGYNAENAAAYYAGDRAADHAVTAVGYDDDYPKENFKAKNTEGEVIEDSIPPENGAFIIKNSWGADEDDPESGYFYLSYYDHSICSVLSYEFDDAASEKHTALHYDQYDLMMTGWYGCSDYDSETKTANVFDAEEDESLCQIAYRTSSPKTEVAYEIYRDVGDDDPSSGTLLEKGVCSHRFAGSYRIDLKREYPLKKGDRYAVVLTMKRTVDENGRMTYTEVFPYSTEFGGGLTVRGVINKGESFLYTDGKWSDMTDNRDSLIERAYRQCADQLGTKQTFTPIKLDSKDAFTVDNYPIKAISAPANEKE